MYDEMKCMVHPTSGEMSQSNLRDGAVQCMQVHNSASNAKISGEGRMPDTSTHVTWQRYTRRKWGVRGGRRMIGCAVR